MWYKREGRVLVYSNGKISMKTFSELCLPHPFKSLIDGRSLAFQGGSVLRRWATTTKIPLCLHTRKWTNYKGGRGRGLFFILFETLMKMLDSFPEKITHM